MNNPLVRILIALLGLAVIIGGVLTIYGGLQGTTLPTKADAHKEAQSALASLTQFKNDSRGIALAYPLHWDLETPADGPLIMKFKTFKGIVNVSVGSEDVSAETTVETYVKATLDQLQKMFTEQKMSGKVLDQRAIQVGDRPAVKAVYSYVMGAEKLDIKSMQIFAMNKNHAYAITLTAPNDLYDEFTGLMDKVLESVKFL